MIGNIYMTRTITIGNGHMIRTIMIGKSHMIRTIMIRKSHMIRTKEHNNDQVVARAGKVLVEVIVPGNVLVAHASDSVVAGG